jgi:uncharacterized protein
MRPLAPPDITRISRQSAGLLRQLAQWFYAIAVTGPRQSGKTTLVREAFPDKPYLTLEDPDQRALAERDPRTFLARFADGAILEEVQRAPLLFNYLQGIVDERRLAGQWVLTGSQQFGLFSNITQSLAGRVAMCELLPLSNGEIANQAVLKDALWLGGYPALRAQRVSRVQLPSLVSAFFASYVRTYIERDVRQLLNVGDLAQFQRFVLMCAARSGQVLNLTALGADCGISHVTALTLLPPYFRNFGKRLVKSPKLYFLDTGLLCYLLQIRSPEELEFHPMRGAVFETWVVTEVLKHRYNRGLAADIYYFRDNHGSELDLLYQNEQGLLQAVEMKSGATFVPEWTSAAKHVNGFFRDEAAPQPLIVYGGQDSYEALGCQVISWKAIK